MHSSSKKKKKGPGSLTDTENKTPKKKNKNKNKGPGNLTDTENKTQKKKRSGQFNWHRKQNQKKKGSGSARKLPGQTDRQTCNFNI